jgi:hypothetical protein
MRQGLGTRSNKQENERRHTNAQSEIAPDEEHTRTPARILRVGDATEIKAQSAFVSI